jgi:glutathione S-transferase
MIVVESLRQIPALEHEGRIRVESLEILQCLEERFGTGPQLYPQVTGRQSSQ